MLKRALKEGILIIHAALPGAATNPAPALEVFASRQGQGIGVIIFPGGGYGHLAEHEGRGYAEFLSVSGVCAFVAHYRLGGQAGHRHPAMLEDGLAAVATVRARAAEFGVRPDCIGVMGSSAGGHLAAHVMTEGSRRAAELRPDFGILCYPVISMQPPYGHAGSRNNLLGPDAPPADWALVSCETLVTDRTPPCFLWHAGDDRGVVLEKQPDVCGRICAAMGCRMSCMSSRMAAMARAWTLCIPEGDLCLRWLAPRVSRPGPIPGAPPLKPGCLDPLVAPPPGRRAFRRQIMFDRFMPG